MKKMMEVDVCELCEEPSSEYNLCKCEACRIEVGTCCRRGAARIAILCKKCRQTIEGRIETYKKTIHKFRTKKDDEHREMLDTYEKKKKEELIQEVRNKIGI